MADVTPADSKQAQLERGDAAPWFRAPALSGRADYAFNTAAGRFALLLFYESAGTPDAAAALRLMLENRGLFDDQIAAFFGITCDPGDAQEGRIAQLIPGVRHFLDYDRAVSRLYHASGPSGYRPQWVLLDRAFRVLDTFPLDRGTEALEALKREIAEASSDSWAPVLEVPNVLPRNMCEELIALYDRDGGEPSGFMRDINGKTNLVVDSSHKMRRDWTIEDEALRDGIRREIYRHLTIPIARAFQFRPTRLERYIVACYAAGSGYFRPHRDNTTRGTAHRKFAVTINLNADYDGGDLRFPEFGDRTYRAPVGGAIVFSCSLLHEATAVTKGRRFAFLPFLYDEEGAKIRESNNSHLGDGLEAYRA